MPNVILYRRIIDDGKFHKDNEKACDICEEKQSSGTVAEYKVTIILVMFAHILLDKDSKSIAYDTFYETGGTRRPRDARSLLLSLP